MSEELPADAMVIDVLVFDNDSRVLWFLELLCDDWTTKWVSIMIQKNPLSAKIQAIRTIEQEVGKWN